MARAPQDAHLNAPTASTPPAPDPAAGVSDRQRDFAVLLVYYWAIQFLLVSPDVQRGSLGYALYVGPVVAFVLLSLVSMGLAVRLPPAAALVTAYATIVTAVAIVRSDFSTAANAVLFSATILTVVIRGLTPSSRLLNALFLASIPAHVLVQMLGWSSLSVIPGFSNDPLWWRISLFPRVPTSGYFALIILFVNLLDRSAPLRRLCVVLAAYFLVFSGIRSAILAAALALAYLAFARLGWFRKAWSKTAFLAMSIAALTASLFANQLFLLIPNLGSEALTAFLLRTSDGFSTEEEAARAIYRTFVWSEHLRLASLNPIFGIGTFDFASLSTFNPVFEDVPSSGSESFLTALLARVGVPAVLLFSAFVWLSVSTHRLRPHLRMVTGLVLFVAMITYGSFITPYDFLFLVMLGLLATRRSPSHELRGRRGTAVGREPAIL